MAETKPQSLYSQQREQIGRDYAELSTLLDEQAKGGISEHFNGLQSKAVSLTINSSHDPLPALAVGLRFDRNAILADALALRQDIDQQATGGRIAALTRALDVEIKTRSWINSHPQEQDALLADPSISWTLERLNYYRNKSPEARAQIGRAMNELAMQHNRIKEDIVLNADLVAAGKALTIVPIITDTVNELLNGPYQIDRAQARLMNSRIITKQDQTNNQSPRPLSLAEVAAGKFSGTIEDALPLSPEPQDVALQEHRQNQYRQRLAKEVQRREAEQAEKMRQEAEATRLREEELAKAEAVTPPVESEPLPPQEEPTIFERARGATPPATTWWDSQFGNQPEPETEPEWMQPDAHAFPNPTDSTGDKILTLAQIQSELAQLDEPYFQPFPGTILDAQQLETYRNQLQEILSINNLAPVQTPPQPVDTVVSPGARMRAILGSEHSPVEIPVSDDVPETHERPDWLLKLLEDEPPSAPSPNGHPADPIPAEPLPVPVPAFTEEIPAETGTPTGSGPTPAETAPESVTTQPSAYQSLNGLRSHTLTNVIDAYSFPQEEIINRLLNNPTQPLNIAGNPTYVSGNGIDAILHFGPLEIDIMPDDTIMIHSVTYPSIYDYIEAQEPSLIMQSDLQDALRDHSQTLQALVDRFRKRQLKRMGFAGTLQSAKNFFNRIF